MSMFMTTGRCSPDKSWEHFIYFSTCWQIISEMDITDTIKQEMMRRLEATALVWFLRAETDDWELL